ncbi:SDR family NAD(P)-dependent oxidoreductase, partial [Rhodococcus hoagii]|nr:SDR family NAD(P)-dependent oxidoreductase [Prescottella equi]
MPAQLTGLDGKVAVVTGAGRMRSIGREIAVELARAGCDVVVTGTGRTPDRFTDEEKAAGWRDIESVADEIRALGRRATAVVADVADEDSVNSLLAQVQAEFGGVDVLVNNAAASRGGDRVPVTELDVDVWDRVLRVNLRGTFLMSRAFARAMVERGAGGFIVNISSSAERPCGADTAAY